MSEYIGIGDLIENIVREGRVKMETEAKLHHYHTMLADLITAHSVLDSSGLKDVAKYVAESFQVRCEVYLELCERLNVKPYVFSFDAFERREEWYMIIKTPDGYRVSNVLSPSDDELQRFDDLGVGGL